MLGMIDWKGNRHALRPQPAQVPTVKGGRRGFAAARIDRLTSSFRPSYTSVDQEIFRDLAVLRGRSRELANNDPYVKKFLQLCKANVVGPTGIALQSQAKDTNGKLDKGATRQIEDAFARWSKRGVCDVTGKLSWTDVQELVIETVARDGECLVRQVRNYNGNVFRFALQILEADQLEVTYNEDLGNGSYVRMGIEFNVWGRPVAYHILTKHPGDMTLYAPSKAKRERLPADEIIHVYDPLRPGQSRGIPWLHAAILRLNMLGGYEEAELVAARTGASKMGFFVPNPEGAGEYQGEKDEMGNLIMEAEPGSFEVLPTGMDFKQWDPDHPSGNFGPFVKAALRGISSGIGVSYNGLANDLEGVNFSSIRSGVLEERDQWMMVQRWFIETLCEPVFEGWLDMAMLTKQVNLPFSKFEKFKEASWQGRRWQWVDPEKDMQANLLALQMGTKTVEDVIRETGRDPETVLEAVAKSLERLAALGLTDVIDFIYKQGMKNVNPKQDSDGNAAP